MLQSDRDGGVGQGASIDGNGAIQIKQEMKLDGEGSYEHAAAVATNSLHSGGGFPAAGQPGQPTTVAAFNTYYETATGNNAGNYHKKMISELIRIFSPNINKFGNLPKTY